LGSAPGLDLGLLAESLLFYGRVHLVANRSVLTELVQLLGPDLTVRLAEEERIQISYCNRFSAIYTEGTGTPRERHLLTVAEMPHTVVENVAPELFIAAVGKSGRGRRLAARLLRYVERVELDNSIAESAQEDARDASYVSSAVEVMLSSLAPAYRLPTNFRFELKGLGENRFRIDTNLDSAAATAAFQQAFSSDAAITPALLASYLVAVHEDLAFAARFGSDIAVSQLTSRLLRLKFASLAEQRGHAEAQIERFEEFVFWNSRAIGDAVRSGAVPFREVLDVVDRSRRFRQWLDEQPADADLLREYFEACTKGSWIDQLPAATVRWALVTAASTAAGAAIAGPAGTGLGVAIGAADFVIERVRQGWKPNHFVEGQMKRLTSEGVRRARTRERGF
jgi:hypothetical protein